MTRKDDRSPADRVRDRLTRWKEMTGQSQEELAKSLGKSKIWLQKILCGDNDARLRHLDLIAHAMRTTAADLVRTDEERYQLELTPTEVRIVEQLRARPYLFDGVAILLRIPASAPPQSGETDDEKERHSHRKSTAEEEHGRHAPAPRHHRAV